MALNIDNYSAWANARMGIDRTAAAALAPDADGASRLADIKTTTSGWARFFRTSGFTAQRDAVRADFRRALTERYGATVAQATMARAVGKDLTAETIARAVAFASLAAARAALTPTDDRRLRLADGDLVVTRQAVNGLSDDGRAALNAFLKAANRAARQLGTVPTGAREGEAFRAANRALVTQLCDVRVRLFQAFLEGGDDALPEADVRRLADHCAALVERLEAHAQAMDDLQANGALSAGSVDAFRDAWFTAFTQTCGRLARTQEDPRAAAALDRLARTTPDAFAAEFKLSKSFAKFLGGVIETVLEEVCGGRSPLAADALKKEVLEGYQQMLNARAWSPIRKAFTGAVGGQALTLTSEIVPGKHVPGVGEAYPPGVNGYMCHSAREAAHAVNLAVSSLRVADGTGAGRTVFAGVRHGVHCAWEIEDADARRAANANRARDAVRAAFAVYLEKHPGLAAGAAVELPMTSVSLLTPDMFRPIQAWFKGENGNNEKMMLREQTEAWRAVDGQALDVVVNGRSYRVTPRVATFNFGVNGGGVGGMSGLIGGWGTSEGLNREAFRVLYARTEAFYRDATVPSARRVAAQALLNQLADVLNARAERRDGHDAYKAAARVAVLTALLDGVPCWNCKSGKDRTGELDVECKFLATLIDRGLAIPEPGAALSREEKLLFRSIALQGGNHEMQMYNTGIAGFKTGGVESIPERLGGREARAVHKGAADFVGV